MKYLLALLLGLLFYSNGLILSQVPWVKNVLLVLGMLFIVGTIGWVFYDLLIKEDGRSPTPPRSVPHGDSLGSRAEFLEKLCNNLATLEGDLETHIKTLKSLVDASGVRSENEYLKSEIENLQDLLTKADEGKKSADLKAEGAQKDARGARDEISKLSKELSDAQKNLIDKQDENKALLAEIRQIKKSEADRLGGIVPAGLLGSTVGEKVRWCFEHASKGDRLAAQILAALQSIKAAQDDDQLKGLLLSSLQVLGQSLSRLLEREQITPAQKCDKFNEWSAALNDLSASRFTITVPSIGARINLNTMVSSGSDDGSVANVHCWGIRDEKGDLAYLAEIS